MTVTWITGASSGIGRGLAQRLAARGERVIASARDGDALARLAAETPNLTAWPLDVTDAAAVTRAIAAIENDHGPIDRAILNAGTHQAMSADDFSTATMRRIIDINLMGHAHCLEPLLARMRARQGGHIAVVASIAAYRGLPTAAAYGASKAAVMNMCESLRFDCDRLGIKLQLVDPGFVKTPLTDKNSFPMPFLMPLDRAIDAFVRGLDSDRFEIVFPRRFVWLVKAARLLPYALYFPLMRRVTRS